MPSKPLEPGDPLTLGRFELLARLGEGGQGVVYLGRGTGPDEERVAVKVLRSSVDATVLQRLARELDAVHKVQPFVTAGVIEASAEGDRRFIVSEFIDGPSLQERVDARGPLPAGDLQRLAVGTATALTAIHGAGVVHRDFKPANVLLGPDGPRVVDFGIARLIDAATITSGLIGTPSYVTPDQLAGERPPSVVAARAQPARPARPRRPARCPWPAPRCPGPRRPGPSRPSYPGPAPGTSRPRYHDPDRTGPGGEQSWPSAVPSSWPRSSSAASCCSPGDRPPARPMPRTAAPVLRPAGPASPIPHLRAARRPRPCRSQDARSRPRSRATGPARRRWPPSGRPASACRTASRSPSSPEREQLTRTTRAASIRSP